MIRSILEKIRKQTTRLSARWPILMLSAIFIAGIIFWGGFNTALEATNNEAFCISCHEMRDNVYVEYKKSIHYQNRTGVRATCPDCHVPKEWEHMVVRKIRATNELFHWMAGTIDTREKFLGKRIVLAQYVWDNMRATDSRECRNCHDIDVMMLKKQRTRARVTHKRARKEGRTCIDCHMGIAHNMPKEFDKDGKLHALFNKKKRPCSDCHKGMALPANW